VALVWLQVLPDRQSLVPVAVAEVQQVVTVLAALVGVVLTTPLERLILAVVVEELTLQTHRAQAALV
jgi:hypothetical protein